MTYMVTDGIAPVAPDEWFDLGGALAYARQLLLDGKPNVTIQDGNGHGISGDDLIACCNGEKTLTPDLRAK
jgi:hypothetical protein